LKIDHDHAHFDIFEKGKTITEKAETICTQDIVSADAKLPLNVTVRPGIE